MMNFNVVLFDGFETLDVFGPVEVFGMLEEQYHVEYFSLEGGIVRSAQNLKVYTLPFSMMDQSGILFVPGGRGTRKLVHDTFFIRKIRDISKRATYILTVCTGAAIVAKAGMLKGKRVTSNHESFDWVCSMDPEADWTRESRFEKDGNIFTSAGISAGIDMALGFIRDLHGAKQAQKIAIQMEYSPAK